MGKYFFEKSARIRKYDTLLEDFVVLTQRYHLHEDEFDENGQRKSLVVPEQEANGDHDHFQNDVFKKAED